MGGTRFARGNANLTAEFNAFADPEAMQIALRYFKGCATMVGWDLTAKHGVPFDWVEDIWLGNVSGGISGPRPGASFLSLCSADIIRKSRAGPWGAHGLLIPDPLAMAVTLDRASVVEESTKCWATIETSGKHTRGMVVIDYDNLFARTRRRSSELEAPTEGETANDDGANRKEEKEMSIEPNEEKMLSIVTKLNMERVQYWLLASTEAE